jgi:hypothetical protein
VLVPVLGCGVGWFFVLGCFLGLFGVGGVVFVPCWYVGWGGMRMGEYVGGWCFRVWLSRRLKSGNERGFECVIWNMHFCRSIDSI